MTEDGLVVLEEFTHQMDYEVNSIEINFRVLDWIW